MKIKNNKIEAVKMMREIREKMATEYNKNPEKENVDLRAIRRKYKFSGKKKNSKLSPI
jgi:hypothetical protein